MREHKKRIWELDFWRGLAIILVVFDHAFFDFGKLFREWGYCGVGVLQWLNSVSLSYLSSDVRFFWRPAFLFLFFCVAGLCTALSKNNFLRGLKLWAVAMAVSFVTYLAESLSGSDVFILFGVLHCLAVVILVYATLDSALKGCFALVEKIMKKQVNSTLKCVIDCAVLLALAGAFLAINYKYNPRFPDMTKNYAVSDLDGKKFGMFFYSDEWWTADYFPLFPYISFFFFGAGLSKILYREKKSLMPSLDGCWHNFFTVAGRHSLAVYLVGQIAVIGLGVILSLIFLGESLLFS